MSRSAEYRWVVIVALGLVLGASPARADPAVDRALARAVAAGAPEAALRALVARGEQRGLPAAELIAALALVEEASSQGLPAIPIAAKLQEGIAKGVPPARLLPAAREVLGRLELAARPLQGVTLGAAERAALVESGAEALRRGASAEALQALWAPALASPGSAARLGPALRELGELGERHAATPAAGSALGRLAVHGYPAVAIDSISTQLDELRAEGGEAEELFAEVSARAAAGRPLDRLVDPFAERPGAVAHDRGAREKPELPPGKSGTSGSHGRNGPEVSPFDRPGTAGGVNPGEAHRKKPKKNGPPAGR